MNRPLRDEIDLALGHWLRLARLALLWESFWRLGWPLASLVLLFLALALFDVLPMLPGWQHALLLALFLAAAIVLLARLRHLKAPGRPAVLGRLEHDSGMAHQPLQLIADSQATGLSDSLSRALWQRNCEAGARLARMVSLRAPMADLARHDPLGFRFAALLLLIIALAGGWGDASNRLRRAVVPEFDWLIGPAPILQVWITPPAYTRIAPMLLEHATDGQPIRVPAGSKLLAELQGGRGHAEIRLGDKTRPFDQLSAGSQRFESTLTEGKSIEIRQGWRKVGSWALDIVANRPPTIEFSARPKGDAQARLQFGITAADEYGVKQAWLIIHRTDRPEAPAHIVELPLAEHGTRLHQNFWQDLTSDPWAGLNVTIWPEATNQAGQRGSGEAVQMVLPERIFTNPVARAIVALRRALVIDPEARPAVMAGLYAIASAPAMFNNDLVVSLGLDVAISRLRYNDSADAIASVVDLLWQVAMRIEDGDRPEAARSLAQARQALQDALARNAPEAEIERLTNELRAAVSRYLQALAADAMKHGRFVQPQPGDRIVSSDDIRRMLDQLRDLSQIGARDAARQMLDQLGQMLDQLGSAAPNSEASRQAQRQLDALAAIARDQRQLLDETRRRMNGRPGDESGGSPSAADQEALRKRLGQVMQGLGDLGIPIPDNLGKAEMAMRAAGRGLRNGAFDQASKAEADALSQLEQGANAARQAMSQGSGGGIGMMPEPGGPLQSRGLDPLGRPLNGTGNADDESVKIPDQADIQKSREVLDEIRRRAGEADRPPAEHDYLDRLLRQLY